MLIRDCLESIGLCPAKEVLDQNQGAWLDGDSLTVCFIRSYMYRERSFSGSMTVAL